MNRILWTLFWLSFSLTAFTACSAALDAFTPTQSGAPAPGTTIVREAAAATGNPLIIAAVNAGLTLLTGILASRSGKKSADDAVAKKDREEWTAEDVTSMAAALRAHGFKVERA